MWGNALLGSVFAVAAAFAPAWAPAWAGGFVGPARGVVERVIDGDTVKVRVGVWIDQELLVSVRVAGIDAPEIFRPKCEAERQRALAAKRFTEEFLGDADVTLVNIGRDKYAGRVVARIEADGRDLGAAMVARGLAVEDARGAWCP